MNQPNVGPAVTEDSLRALKDAALACVWDVVHMDMAMVVAKSSMKHWKPGKSTFKTIADAESNYITTFKKCADAAETTLANFDKAFSHELVEFIILAMPRTAPFFAFDRPFSTAHEAARQMLVPRVAHYCSHELRFFRSAQDHAASLEDFRPRDAEVIDAEIKIEFAAAARTLQAIRSGHVSDATKWLTVTEATSVIDVHKSTLSRLCDSGEVESKGTGPKRRVNANSLARYKIDTDKKKGF